MTPWPIALVLALLFTMFGLLALSMAVGVLIRFVMELFRVQTKAGLFGWFWLSIIVLPFMYMVGFGAWRLIGAAVGGFIGRFA